MSIRRGRRPAIVVLCALVVATLLYAVRPSEDSDEPASLTGQRTTSPARPAAAARALLSSDFSGGREGWDAGSRSVARQLERGNGVLKVRRAARTPGLVQALSPGVRARRGEQVTAVVRLRAVHGSVPVRVRLLAEGKRQRVVLAGAGSVVSAAAWRRVAVTVRVTRPAPSLRVRVTGQGVRRSGGLLIDKVRVSAVPGATRGPGATTSTDDQTSNQTTDPAGTPCERLDYSQPSQGALDWSDDFSGTTVDQRRWRVRDGESLSYDQARIMAANVSVADGVLAITARRQDVSGRPYSSGYLDTIGHYSRQWGRWEVRAKLPTTVGDSRGIWPAFWLRADHTSGEIDVMEAWGEPTSRTDYRSGSYQWTVHQDTNSGPGTQRRSGWGTAVGQPPVANAFHLYAVDWSPDCLVFSFDGHVVGIVRRSEAPWLASSFASPVNIRLNLQVGQNYWGFADPARPDLTALPARLLVDYVRVYRPRWAG